MKTVFDWESVPGMFDTIVRQEASTRTWVVSISKINSNTYLINHHPTMGNEPTKVADTLQAAKQYADEYFAVKGYKILPAHYKTLL